MITQLKLSQKKIIYIPLTEWCYSLTLSCKQIHGHVCVNINQQQNYNTFIFIIQLAMADDTLTLESDEQGPNKIESLKCLLQTSSAWDSFHPFFQSVS